MLEKYWILFPLPILCVKEKIKNTTKKQQINRLYFKQQQQFFWSYRSGIRFKFRADIKKFQRFGFFRIYIVLRAFMIFFYFILPNNTCRITWEGKWKQYNNKKKTKKIISKRIFLYVIFNHLIGKFCDILN